MSHKCHLPGCEVDVQPRYLLCPRHWRVVPLRLKQAVWKYYVAGQEVTKTPTVEYLNAVKAAINSVAEREERK